MTAPEQDVLETVCDRVKALIIALDEDLALLGAIPTDIAAFDAMPTTSRVGSRALLKTVEQLEDQMMRLFRIILYKLDVDTKDLFARDIANRMEALQIVADAHAWMEVVRLRNRLVHDYPLTQQARFTKLAEAGEAAGLLRSTAENAFSYLGKKEWLA